MERQKKGEEISMFLIAGLGNPGREYVDTRHNVGFEAVTVLSSYYDIPLKKIKHKAIIGEGKIDGERVILAEPQTFMNNSGESIREIADFYKIPVENILIIYDEAALDTGRIRIRPGGSAGGHNGMKSIIYHLGSDAFPRVRFGIGAARGDMANHVLGKFSSEEIKLMIDAVKNIPAIASLIINGNISEAMNKFNRFNSGE